MKLRMYLSILGGSVIFGFLSFLIDRFIRHREQEVWHYVILAIFFGLFFIVFNYFFNVKKNRK